MTKDQEKRKEAIAWWNDLENWRKEFVRAACGKQERKISSFTGREIEEMYNKMHSEIVIKKDEMKIDIVDKINFASEQFGLEIKVSMRGYTSTIKYSYEDRCYYGKIEDISDLVLFEGKDIGEACYAFVEAVNDYFYNLKGIKRDE